MEFSKRLFLVSVISAMFAYGFIAGRYRVFPSSVIVFGGRAVRQVVSDIGTITNTRPNWFIQPVRYPGNGVTRLDEKQMAPGLTLISGFFDGDNGVRLIRPDGSAVNRWRTRFYDMFSDVSHIAMTSWVPQTNWNVLLHGTIVLPDGSLIFNFDQGGVVKMDRCGIVQWKLPRMTHHSLEQSEDGAFWVPAYRYVADKSPYPGLRPPYAEDTILKVSSEAKVLREISVEEILFKNDMQALLITNKFQPGGNGQELLHLNDVEELRPNAARAFSQFAAGDLLVSLRYINLILVVDPDSLKIKWHQIGPWLAQHDPDFQPNGQITVFNNNSDGDVNRVMGDSNIMEVNPAIGRTTIKYGAAPDQKMFTGHLGKHQVFENGNILVTEGMAGRAFEVNQKGDVVWEFVNRYDETNSALVTEATRYPESYFTVKDWKCDALK